jgi:hypothetical protein
MKAVDNCAIWIALMAVFCCVGCSSPESRFLAAFEEIQTDSLHIYELYPMDTSHLEEKILPAIPNGPEIDTADFFAVTGIRPSNIDSIWGGYRIPNGEESFIYLLNARAVGSGSFFYPSDTGLVKNICGINSIFLMVADSGFKKVSQFLIAGDRWSAKSADADFNSWLLDLDEDGDLDLVRRINMIEYGAASSRMEEKGWSKKRAIKEMTMDFIETYTWENEGFGTPTETDTKRKENRFRFKTLLINGYYRKSWEYPY